MKLLILFNCSVDDECIFLSSSMVVVFDDFEPESNAGVCKREKLPKSDFSKSELLLDAFFLLRLLRSSTPFFRVEKLDSNFDVFDELIVLLKFDVSFLLDWKTELCLTSVFNFE